jgi:uncharacterized protein YdeI (YjbR/CyaY-like superfamily)
MAREDSLHFTERQQWRGWLEKYHNTETEAWLVIYKVKYQSQGLSLEAAVEEALCYGWIDSTLNRHDQKRYLLRFSPRREASVWSVSNIQRAEQLIRAGKMTEAGLITIKQAKESGQWQAALQREQVDLIPEDLERALSNVKGGVAAYQALPNSRKKQLIYWLNSAKREETRTRRIKSIVEEVLRD